MAILRRFAQILLVAATLVVAVVAAAVIVSQTGWFKNWLRGVIVQQAERYLNGTLTIDRVAGNLFSGIELEGVRIVTDGRPTLQIADAGIEYRLVQLLSGDVIIRRIRLNGLVVHLRRDESGWTIGQLVKRQREEAERRGPGRSVTLGDIGVSDGEVVFETPVGSSAFAVPQKLDRIDARLSFAYEPVRSTVEIAHLSLRGHSPAIGLNALSGKVSVRDDDLHLENLAVRTEETSLAVDGAIEQYARTPSLALRVHSDKFTLSEIGRLVPALKEMTLQPAFEVSARGPLQDLEMEIALRSASGDVSGPLRADFASRVIRLKGELSLRRLNLDPLVKTAANPTDITGLAGFDLAISREPDGTSVSGPFRLNAEHVAAFGFEGRNVAARGRVDGTRIRLDAVKARAYGANTTASGTIEIVPARGRDASRVVYDVAGRVSEGDLRRLPARLRMPRVASRLDLDYDVTGVGSALRAEATLRPSEFAGASLGDGTTGSFEMDGQAISYAAKGTLADLDLQRIGDAFDIAALTAPRYRSSIAGSFDVQGSGTSLDTLTLGATGRLADSRIFEASVPEMSFDARVSGGRLDVTADGRIENLDPAVATGSTAAAGSISGRVDGRLAILELGKPVLPDRFEFDGEVGLEHSSFGKFPLDRLALRGNYAGRGVHVERLEAAGAGLSATASGRLVLAEQGSSDLAIKAESTSLAQLADLLGRPLTGGAVVDVRVTGNGSLLRADGRVEASGVHVGPASALKLASQFDAEVPDLTPSRTRVSAAANGTFVEVAGQEINEVRAKATYADNRVGFELNLRQVPRIVDAAGTVALHPDHQEVHLQQLALRTEGQLWQLAPGSDAAVQYRTDTIAVKGLQLVSGFERIEVEGTLGQGAPGLLATATGVDLSRLDALLLGNNRLGGTLDANARITGALNRPSAEASFAVSGGAFRGFRYQSLFGKVDYGDGRLNLDVRLEERPTQWIGVRGLLPLALFRGLPPGSPGLSENVDLHVESSVLDLGIVQGITNQLQKVSGTARANLRLGGQVADPTITGRIDLRNGAFTVVPTQVSYEGLEAGILFLPGQLVIEGMRVTDDDGNPLSLGGVLGVEARSIGSVSLQVQGRGFEIVNNDYGQARLETDLTVTGELLRPQVRGDIRLTAGEVNLDRVLEQAMGSAYSTTPAAASTGNGEGAGRPPAIGGPGARVGATGPGVPPGDGALREAPSGTAGSAPLSAAAQIATVPPLPASPGGLYHALGLNVQLRIPNDLVVKGQDLRVGPSPVGLGEVNVTLGGDLRLFKKSGSTLRLSGEVNTVRGTYDFQGRRFEILRDGRIRFEGSETLDPSLDITARRVISGVEADVNLRGSVRQPELELTSQPPLDEADILSLIVFGQPANELGQGQQVSLARRAQALATGFVASKVADSIGQALDLDVFEISTTPEAGARAGAGATVTVGEQVGERLFVKLRQGVGADNLSQFVLDYQIADFVRVEATMSQGGTAARSLLRSTERGGVDLIFFFSY